MQVKYLLKCDPYEEKASFGAVKIRTSREVTAEVDAAQLSTEARTGLFSPFTLSRYRIDTAIYGVVGDEIEVDHELTPDEILALIEQTRAQKAVLQKEIEQRRARFADERAARLREEEEARKARAQEEAERKQQDLLAAEEIAWDANGKVKINLYDRLMLLADLEADSRFSNWVRVVESVNVQADNAYAFEGKYVDDKTVEIDRSTRALYLVAATSGSAKYHTTHYRVILLRDGRFERTTIQADNSDRGWAILIRDQVAALLAELSSARPQADSRPLDLDALEAQARDGQPCDPQQVLLLIKAYRSSLTNA